MSRADRSAIRQAILLAAEKTSQETPPRQVLTGDVKAALEELSRRQDIRPERASRLADMAEAMGIFCTGVNGRFFNREGKFGLKLILHLSIWRCLHVMAMKLN